ncbi:MAG: hypothetical protein JW776_12185 [Candidatus Lokiarchaeota archaeon]|nr:hypothetical protein [Candidatus Lokiarchaeota archaeon]
MQAPTHMLTGVFLLVLFQAIFPNAPIWIQVLVIFPLSFASHFLIDASAIITYHPPKSDWKDPFWVSYHLVIYILTIVVAIYFWRAYWWTMIAATLVDIVDWIFLRAIFKKKAILHPIADKLRNFLYKKTPNWNYKRWTVIFEFIIMGILLTLILILR